MIKMDAKQFGKKILFRIDKGEELVESICKICAKFDIKLGYIASGIGATDNGLIGVYDMNQRIYHPTEITSFYEITNLSGNISTMGTQPYFHFHITLGNPIAMAGHLNKAIISATFEGVIEIIDGEVDREKDSDTGLNLLKFQ
jgi:predicted DNA-binding protein with PD1-like motif